jgi:hypothetical protein
LLTPTPYFNLKLRLQLLALGAIVTSTVNWLMFLNKGDSGGPLTVNESGKHVVVGITSYGFGCGSWAADVLTR